MKSYARKSDPKTSHQAAESVQDLPEKAQAVLRVLKKARTDEQMVDAYKALKSAPWASPSGLRTLRANLFRQGLIVDTGKRILTESRRHAIVWKTK
jgi:hypothetical protein